jgi:hypothetical protein
LLPLFARWGRGKRLLDRVGASTPAPSTIVWFVVAIILLLIYPVDFTGEWVEVLAGALFSWQLGPLSARCYRAASRRSLCAGSHRFQCA